MLNWGCRCKRTVTVPLLLAVLEVFCAERGRRSISNGKNAGQMQRGLEIVTRSEQGRPEVDLSVDPTSRLFPGRGQGTSRSCPWSCPWS